MFGVRARRRGGRAAGRMAPLSRKVWELDPVPTATGAAGPTGWPSEWTGQEGAPPWGEQLTRRTAAAGGGWGAPPLLEAAGTRSFGIRISWEQREGCSPP